MRLYNTIRQVLRLATHLYFVEVRSTGRDQVPEEGPVILAANHPSSLLDSVLLGVELPRPVSYLAKSELFRTRWLAALYRSVGAIPLKRGVGSDELESTFEQVYELLERGGCIGIFPEGRNSPALKVANLRSGTARMALAAEERNQYRLGLTIVPVGINFENRELFLSAALLRFGEPIQVADYAELHRTDRKRAIRELTADLGAALRREAMHIEDARLSALINDLGAVYHKAIAEPADEITRSPSTGWLRAIWEKWRAFFRPASVNPESLAAVFDGKRSLNDALSRAAVVEPELIDELRTRVERYKDHLRQTKLKQDLKQSFDQPLRERLIRLRMTLYAVLMAPIALYGWVHNVVPYVITKLISHRFKDEAVRAFSYFGVGTLAFAGFYFLYLLWLWHFTPRDLSNSLLYIATLPPTGLLCLRYRGHITQYRDKILFRTFFYTNANLMRQLQEERQAIIYRLQILDERYGDPED
ncbi:lysophospholipid acyltransferase family protein [Salinispirillum marinum]|uniref:Lysophospholipid acyltransferase family protein n=2 Tax=Saccharospirillaceae TaxID=255527 RepID=A0ABV8BGJ4_9GAMM